MVCSIPRLTKSEEMAGHMHQAYAPHVQRGNQSGHLSEGRMEKSQKEMPFAQIGEQTGPQKGQRVVQKAFLVSLHQSENAQPTDWRRNGTLGDPPPPSPSHPQTADF
ncbi:hypothetical protein H1C71_035174 [Ictidomys tridecemlineatus]|nr:hypothetical protein H1C71_035174 [Ictidomys tridecemlineatus]